MGGQSGQAGQAGQIGQTCAPHLLEQNKLEFKPSLQRQPVATLQQPQAALERGAGAAGPGLAWRGAGAGGCKCFGVARARLGGVCSIRYAHAAPSSGPGGCAVCKQPSRYLHSLPSCADRIQGARAQPAPTRPFQVAHVGHAVRGPPRQARDERVWVWRQERLPNWGEARVRVHGIQVDWRGHAAAREPDARQRRGVGAARCRAGRRAPRQGAAAPHAGHVYPYES